MPVNPNNSKRDDNGVYSTVISEIAREGKCPFCQENLAAHHKNPILREGAYWLLTKNMYPYKGTSHHLLIILKRHTTRFEEIDKDEFAELQELISWYTRENNVTGGSIFMRSGDTSLTGASVEHLHAQFVSRDLDFKEPLLVKLG